MPKLLITTTFLELISNRSGNIKNLQNKKDAIDFGKRLWSKIIIENIDSLQLLVCIDNITMNSVLEILSEFGLKEKEPQSLWTGWGNVQAYIKRFEYDGKTITFLKLPHLGRFTIFGRKNTENQIMDIVHESVKYYKH
jgi:hypothetical protein